MSNLAFENRPLSGDKLWCDRDDWKSVLNNMEVSDADKDVLHDFIVKGYSVIKKAIPLEIADAARDDYEKLIESSSFFQEQTMRDRRLPNFHYRSESAKKVFTGSVEALRFQDLLFGYRSSVYTSLYFEQGTEQPIHRDIPVFCTKPSNFYFGVWYALEDAHARNGALRTIPGGHKIDTIDPYLLALKNVEKVDHIHPTTSPMWSIYQEAVTEKCVQEGLDEISVELEKGDVLIWHPLLPHGGGEILDKGSSRHSMVYHVVPEGCPVYQMDVFFNSDQRNVPDLASWDYDEFEDRLFAIR